MFMVTHTFLQIDYRDGSLIILYLVVILIFTPKKIRIEYLYHKKAAVQKIYIGHVLKERTDFHTAF